MPKDYPLLPTLESCKYCQGIKSTMWDGTGFTVTQRHKKDCLVLAELKAKYPKN